MIKGLTPAQLSAFRPYSRLTVVTNVKGQVENNRSYHNNEVSIKDFQEILKKRKWWMNLYQEK